MGVSPGTYRRNGAFAEYIAIPRHILYKIPDNVSFEEAAMVEPAAVALHSINISGLQAGNSTLVVGAGMIGIFIVRLLKISGASVIFAIDTKMERNRKALESGADFAFHPDDRSIIERIKSQTGNRGTDISFEVIGKSISIQFAVENTRRGGTIVLVGNTSPVVDFPLQKVVTGEMKVLGSCAICGEYEIVLDLLSKRRFTVNDQIGAVAPLSQGAQWFEKLYKNELNPGKVILVP
jgi:L-iditol 2-dehydrogenase